MTGLLRSGGVWRDEVPPNLPQNADCVSPVTDTLWLAHLLGPLLARRRLERVPVEVARLGARRRRHAEEQDVRAPRLVGLIRPSVVQGAVGVYRRAARRERAGDSIGDRGG